MIVTHYRSHMNCNIFFAYFPSAVATFSQFIGLYVATVVFRIFCVLYDFPDVLSYWLLYANFCLTLC